MKSPARGVKVARRGPQVLALTAVLLLLGVLLAAGLGTIRINPGSVGGIVLYKLGLRERGPWPAVWENIILLVRLPRVMLGLVVGMSLGLAGTVMQGLFKNPLADPFIMGVSSGASLGAVAGLTVVAGWLHASPLTVVPPMSFAGGLLAVGLVWRLASFGGRVPMTSLLLAGVSVGSLLSALMSLLVLFNLKQADKIWLWLLGGLSGATWTQVVVLLPYLAGAGVLLLFFRQDLNALLLGEETAKHLGVNADRVRLILVLVATLLTATAVAFAGSIGFVGLIVPHVVRFFVGPDHRWVLPVSALGGGLVLVVADTIGRLGVTEVPVGAVMALVGGPFFLGLLRRSTRQRMGRA